MSRFDRLRPVMSMELSRFYHSSRQSKGAEGSDGAPQQLLLRNSISSKGVRVSPVLRMSTIGFSRVQTSLHNAGATSSRSEGLMVSPGRWSRQLFLAVLFAFTINRAAMGEDWLPITPEERSRAGLPEQPGAAAVVLLREEVSDDPHNNRTVYMRIKVLTEPGRRFADVE